MGHGLQDHTAGIYISGSVTLPIAIESSTVTFVVSISECTVTIPILLTDSDIMMPVDIQAQYVTLDINIAASAVTLNVAIESSAVTLNVNISSQTANINVNLAASAVTMNVNITGSTTLNISVTAQTVGISIQSEWQSISGNVLTLLDEAAIAKGASTGSYYVPDSGKLVYVYGVSFATRSGAAEGDNPQEIQWAFKRQNTYITKGVINKQQPTHTISFATPIRFTHSTSIGLEVTNYGAAAGYYYQSWWGYIVNA
jgi:hypothetical protein